MWQKLWIGILGGSILPLSGSMRNSCTQPLTDDEMSAGLTGAIKIKTLGQWCFCAPFIFVSNLQCSHKTRRHSLQVSVYGYFSPHQYINWSPGNFWSLCLQQSPGPALLRVKNHCYLKLGRWSYSVQILKALESSPVVAKARADHSLKCRNKSLFDKLDLFFKFEVLKKIF